jgi:hypothetical protein
MQYDVCVDRFAMIGRKIDVTFIVCADVQRLSHAATPAPNDKFGRITTRWTQALITGF